MAEKVINVLMMKLVDDLKETARGAAQGASWKEGLSATAAWNDILKQAAPLLDGDLALQLNSKYKAAEEDRCHEQGPEPLKFRLSALIRNHLCCLELENRF